MRKWMPSRSCRRTRRNLQSYLDGECDPVTGWQVARHVAQCEACFADAEKVRTLKATVARLRLAPDPHVLRRLKSIFGLAGGPPGES